MLFWGRNLIRRERYMIKNKQTLFIFMTEWGEETNWPQRKTQFHVADPATFLASNLFTYFPLRAACPFIYGKNEYFCVCIIVSLILSIFKFSVWISSPKLHRAPLNLAALNTCASLSLMSLHLFMLSALWSSAVAWVMAAKLADGLCFGCCKIWSVWHDFDVADSQP